MFLPSKVIVTRLERPGKSGRVVSSIPIWEGSFHKRKLSSLLNIERLFSGLKGVKTSHQNLTIVELVNLTV